MTLKSAKLCGRRVWSALLGVALVPLLPVFLVAQEPTPRLYRDLKAWVEETEGKVSAPSARVLTVRTDRGSIRVRTGPAGEVHYRIRKLAYHRTEEQARELFQRFSVRVRQIKDEVRILGEQQPRWPERLDYFSVEYEVMVPPDFRAYLETAGGNLEVEAPLRGLRASSAGGNIRTGDLGGEAAIETLGGNIVLGRIGGALRALTAGGDIHVEGVEGSAVLETSGGQIACGRVNGGVRAQTAGGDIHIEAATADILAQTAGGRILVGSAGGRVQAETAGGSIRVADAAGLVEARTAGGEIELEHIRAGVRAATAAGNILARILGEGKLPLASVLETSGGDVIVYLTPELALTIDAIIEMSGGHKIQTDFPLKTEGAGQFTFAGDRVRGYGELNGGGQPLKIRTVGGRIAIRKLTEELPEQQTRWKRLQERLRERLKPVPKPPPPEKLAEPPE